MIQSNPDNSNLREIENGSSYREFELSGDQKKCPKVEQNSNRYNSMVFYQKLLRGSRFNL